MQKVSSGPNVNPAAAGPSQADHAVVTNVSLQGVTMRWLNGPRAGSVACVRHKARRIVGTLPCGWTNNVQIDFRHSFPEGPA